MKLSNTSWIFYSIAHTKHLKKWAPKTFLAILDQMALKHPRVLGVAADLGAEKGLLLSLFITPEHLASLFNDDSEGEHGITTDMVIKSCEDVIDGKHQVVKIPMDDIDKQTYQKLHCNVNRLPHESEGEHMSRVVTLMWSMRSETPRPVEMELFIRNHKGHQKHETGDLVIVHLVNGQCIHGIKSVYKAVDGVSCVDVVIAEPAAINVNSDVLHFEIGCKVTVPVDCLESIGQIVAEAM